jgi:hypothetical protein
MQTKQASKQAIVRNQNGNSTQHKQRRRPTHARRGTTKTQRARSTPRPVIAIAVLSPLFGSQRTFRQVRLRLIPAIRPAAKQPAPGWKL